VHAEQRRRLGDGEERGGVIARHRPTLLQAPRIRARAGRANGGSGKNRGPDARNGMWRARWPVRTDRAYLSA
jgi:hypothetical protein